MTRIGLKNRAPPGIRTQNLRMKGPLLAGVSPACDGEVVRPLGFEPRTCGLRVRCSAVELEARMRKGDASRPRPGPVPDGGDRRVTEGT